MSCATINRGSNPDCENLPDAGTRARLILINYRDVESITDDVNGKITDIQLSGDATAYEFLGFRADVKKSDGVLKTSRKNRFSHSCGFVVYEVDQVQKNNVRRIAKGRFLAIVENRGKNDDSIELLGRNVGLRITSGPVRDAQEGGVFIINLETPGGAEFETKLPQTVGVDYESGLGVIEAVLTGNIVWGDLEVLMGDTVLTFAD